MRRLLYFEGVFPCCLAILVAGAFLEPISSQELGHNPSRDGQPQTCDSQERAAGSLVSSVDLTLRPDSDSISFKCSSTLKATRTPGKEQVFAEPACSLPVTLTSLFTGATLAEDESEEGKKTYTLTIPNDSRKATEQALYYKCTLEKELHHKNGNAVSETEGQVCKVKITVEAVNKDEPDPEQNGEPQTSIIECSNTTSTEEASISAEAPLSFKCGTGMSLHPTNLTDVFDDQDGKCAAEVGLQTLVDATLTKAETEATQNGQPVYQLAVKTAPSEDTALCYKCVTTSSNLETKTNSEESAAKECLLKISVKGSASSAFSSTWGAAKTAIAFFVTVPPLLGVVDI
ncbi:SRS domain-containing protein [Neospora caninum Liverpool]|uniref:SRS domain-containing protein n=1 Tax=Neospora caninum (strain Liverpool) TaxID=572307 RepID=F0VL87_NEOCL|nr:SRS domain-containing protein [Neospora caninum Liverpool]CBZ54839.1 SRS domain-containing protein [Neospora caninum Liverpool]CEL69558.1 TPA: SRS domain-containing protein [Neospora caninum Liverpool]|eukprot:XP_003884867.1 SRS domain-containing protein [Neospora caninum Liverpool]